MVELKQDWLGLAAAARLVPGRPSPATLWRWARIGIRGTKLEHLVVGGRVFTSEAAIARFLEASTAADAQRFEATRRQREVEREAIKAAAPRPASERRRRREIERAKASLRAEGIRV